MIYLNKEVGHITCTCCRFNKDCPRAKEAKEIKGIILFKVPCKDFLPNDVNKKLKEQWTYIEDFIRPCSDLYVAFADEKVYNEVDWFNGNLKK